MTFGTKCLVYRGVLIERGCDYINFHTPTPYSPQPVDDDHVTKQQATPTTSEEPMEH